MIIREYTQSSFIELSVIKQVNDLVNASNIGESFDFGDYLYLGFHEEKVVAIEVFRLDKYDTGEILPRFIHIIFSPEVRNSKNTVRFLLGVEGLMRNKHKWVWAYILKDKINMLILARKFGFKDTDYNSEGYTLLKEI